jgi:RNA polymerase sigma-70 factor (ECF subfamily)
VETASVRPLFSIFGSGIKLSRERSIARIGAATAGRIEEKPLSGVTSFELIATSHLDAAYSLARWLTRDAVLAEDVVQDAMVRALTYFAGFRGDNPRAWLLQIVRNVALGRLGARAEPVSIDAAETSSGESLADTLVDGSDGPETTLEREQDRRQVSELLGRLPVELRECLVLREIEDCSYKEIARIIDAPIGTVMSRLWRARQMLSDLVDKREKSR